MKTDKRILVLCCLYLIAGTLGYALVTKGLLHPSIWGPIALTLWILGAFYIWRHKKQRRNSLNRRLWFLILWLVVCLAFSAWVLIDIIGGSPRRDAYLELWGALSWAMFLWWLIQRRVGNDAPADR